MLRAITVFLFLACAAAQGRTEQHGKRTLVVLGNNVNKDNYSNFFGALERISFHRINPTSYITLTNRFHD